MGDTQDATDPLLDLGVVTVIFEPGHRQEPIRVRWNDDGDHLDVETVVGLLRAAASDLCRQHAVDGRECLEDFLTTYPMPAHDTGGPL